MQIWIIGDPHSDFEPLQHEFTKRDQTSRPEHLIFLGDQSCLEPMEAIMMEYTKLGVDYSFILGNHDTDSVEEYDNLMTKEAAKHSIDGIVTTLKHGLRIAGLGGVFRERVWDGKLQNSAPPRFRSPKDYLKSIKSHETWRGGLPLKHRSTIFPASYDALARQRADLLFTHEGPGANEYGFESLGALALSMGVRYHFHGHLHIDVAYEPAGKCRSFGINGTSIYQIDLLNEARNGWVYKSQQTPMKMSKSKG